MKQVLTEMVRDSEVIVFMVAGAMPYYYLGAASPRPPASASPPKLQTNSGIRFPLKIFNSINGDIPMGVHPKLIAFEDLS